MKHTNKGGEHGFAGFHLYVESDRLATRHSMDLYISDGIQIDLIQRIDCTYQVLREIACY